VQHILPSDANLALAAGNYAKAGELFQALLEKNPDAAASKVGLVRSRIGENRIPEALDLATRFATSAPDDAMIETVLGEVRFRRGEVGEAAVAFNKAMHIDPCLGRVHYDIARFRNLSGDHLTAQKQIDLAHQLSPDDPEISLEQDQAHAKQPSKDELIASLTKRMNSDKSSEEQKKGAESTIKSLRARSNGDCEMVGTVDAATLKLAPIQTEDGSVTSMALDMEMNGKRERLEVDTGASGLTISKVAAARAGLATEAEIRMGGIGDQGSVRSFITHVDKLRIGEMEFHNCQVEVLDRSSLRTDGLIGTDVFSRWLVTIDTPGRELRLAPLPKRPDEGTTPQSMRLETDWGGIGEANEVPHDRYIAPEMDSWTRIYRSRHFIILPVRVNQLPAKLFIMDTGAFDWTLTPALAKEIGSVIEVDTIIRGISGEANHVYTVDKQVDLDFAGVRQYERGITVIDTSATTQSVGVEISGFLGFTALRELIVSIDYRDNLVKVVFDPKHGFHSTVRMQ
jgi:predicted aspartyl protease